MMKYNSFKKYYFIFFCIIILIVISGLPFVSLLTSISQRNALSFNGILSIRRLRVLMKTISFSGIVSFIVTTTGFFLAISVYLYKKLLYPFFIILILFIIVPPYIHAIGWIEFSTAFLKEPILSGVGISIFVQTLYFLPFAGLLCYVSILHINQSYFDISRMNIGHIQAVFLTIVKLSLAPFVMVFLVIFLLSSNDYTIPSIYAFNTYPIEIMTVFSSSTNLLEPILATFPFLFICVVVAIVIYIIFNKFYSQYEVERIINFPKVRNNYLMMLLFAIIVFAQILVPVIFLIFDMTSMKSMFSTVINSYEEIMFSLICVFISSAVIVLTAFVFAYGCMFYKKIRTLYVTLFAFQLGIPASIFGISILCMYNNRITDELYYSPLLTSHALILRFLPVGFFIIYGSLSKFKSSHLDAVRMYTDRHIYIIKHIILPYAYPAVISAFFIVFVLGFGDLGATIMVVPPGKSTLTITIYNYLHYGSSSAVKDLCLFVLIFCICTASMIMLIHNYRSYKEKRVK